ncbi:Sccpdh [Scenedesmus sp. PABB004]|nr:Sccpdh [Scenedesmus sp. PABB004]
MAAAREFDVVVFGATGFTGQRVLEEALRALPPSTRLAVAGRSAASLSALAQRLAAPGRLQVIGGVQASDDAALAAMAARTRLLLNCAGPFRELGGGVFAACAAAGTDYLDICGEPEFIERMALRHGAAAAASGAVMASAAGFDSLPADMGALMVSREFVPPAVPGAVEAVITLAPGPGGTSIHYATWAAAVQGMGSVAELRRLRGEARRAGLNPPPRLLGPRPKAPEGPTWDARLGLYTLPFPGADASVVRRTQSALAAAGEPAVHFTARFTVPSAWAAVQFVFWAGLVFSTLCKAAWGRALLLRFPGFFSRGLVTHAGPSEAQMAATTTTLDFFAAGWSAPPPPGVAPGAPDRAVHAQVTLGDPGYRCTAVMLVAAAATLLEDDRNAMLAAVGGRGGVFTVGQLFRNSSLMSRLDARGVRYAVKRAA